MQIEVIKGIDGEMPDESVLIRAGHILLLLKEGYEENANQSRTSLREDGWDIEDGKLVRITRYL